MKKNHLDVLEINWCYKCCKGQVMTRMTNWKIGEELTQNSENGGKDIKK